MGSSKGQTAPGHRSYRGKRILYVCEYGTLNGGERSLLAWLPELKQAGIHADVLAPHGSPLAAAVAALGINSVSWNLAQKDPSTLLHSRRQRLTELLRAESYDLVHANSLSASRIVGPVAEDLAVPSMGHLRDIIRISKQAMLDLNANSRLLAVSHATANWHITFGLNPDRTHVLYNGVDGETFAPRPATGYLHRELQLPNGAPLLGAIGQIGMRKGLDTLLEATRLVLRNRPDLHLLIVGERNSAKEEAVAFEADLHEAASEEALAGRVHFLGYRNDVPRLLNELQALVHLARQEPLGGVLLEAAAAGVPVVATDVGGTGEIFAGEEAALVAPDDPADAARQLLQVLREPAAATEQAMLARRSILSRFSVLRSVTGLLSHYRAML